MSKPQADKQIEVPDHLIKQLLTDSELRMLKQRYLILNLLEEGHSVRSIASQVGVGTDTVVRTSKMSLARNLRRPNDRKKNKTVISSTTPWVFGKSE